MAQKYVGYERVLAVKTKGVPEDKILVKLRRDGHPPYWKTMSKAEYAQKAVLR